MATVAFRCDSCGAPLAVGSAAQLLSCRYCGSHSALPSNPQPAEPPLDPTVERDLARIDRDWEQEKAQYLIACRDGSRFAPKPAGILAGGVVYLLFMVVYNLGAWTIALEQVAKGEGAPAFPWAPFLCLPLLGAVFTAAGIGCCVAQFKSALRYREAYRRYRQRRAAVSLRPRRQVPGRCQALGKRLGNDYWWQAYALEETKGLYRIHYRGWSDRYDEWLPRAKVRFSEDEE